MNVANITIGTAPASKRDHFERSKGIVENVLKIKKSPVTLLIVANKIVVHYIEPMNDSDFTKIEESLISVFLLL